MTSKPTHMATVVAYSYEDEPDIHVEIKWEPTLSGDDIEEQGYIPAAYMFVQQVVELAAEAAVGALELELEDGPRTIN